MTVYVTWFEILSFKCWKSKFSWKSMCFPQAYLQCLRVFSTLSLPYIKQVENNWQLLWIAIWNWHIMPKSQNRISLRIQTRFRPYKNKTLIVYTTFLLCVLSCFLVLMGFNGLPLFWYLVQMIMRIHIVRFPQNFL